MDIVQRGRVCLHFDPRRRAWWPKLKQKFKMPPRSKIKVLAVRSVQRILERMEKKVGRLKGGTEHHLLRGRVRNILLSPIVLRWDDHWKSGDRFSCKLLLITVKDGAVGGLEWGKRKTRGGHQRCCTRRGEWRMLITTVRLYLPAFNSYPGQCSFLLALICHVWCLSL